MSLKSDVSSRDRRAIKPNKDVDQVSSLLGEIYDAALDPAQWPSTLKQVAHFIGGVGAGLISKDIVRAGGLIHFHDGGISQRYIDLYFQTYFKLDPSNTNQFFAELEKPNSTTDFMDYQEFLESRFYKEWAKPQRLIDCMLTTLDKTTTSTTMSAVFRHESQGMIDDTARHRMRLLAPHLRRAMLIGNVIGHKTAESETFAAVLQSITAGLFLVRADGRIAHANAAGHRLLAAGDAVSEAGGHLIAHDASANAALALSFAGARDGDVACGVQGIAVPLQGRSQKRYVAHVLPLTAGARRGVAKQFFAVASVFVYEATMRTPAAPELIAQQFALTPTELRVLLAVVETGGVPQAVEALGIAESTVKWHLRHLFAKTGTNQQTELVKLVAGYASPAAG